jgi:hypothetical protein
MKTMKTLLNAIHDVVHAGLHIALVPVMAVLKAVIAGLTHLQAELEKI